MVTFKNQVIYLFFIDLLYNIIIVEVNVVALDIATTSTNHPFGRIGLRPRVNETIALTTRLPDCIKVSVRTTTDMRYRN